MIKREPVFSTEKPLWMHKYKFSTKQNPNGFTVNAPSLTQARNWLSVLNQQEIKILTITKKIDVSINNPSAQ